MAIKSVIKKIIGKKNMYRWYYIKKIQRCQNISLMKSIFNCKFYNNYNKLFSKVSIEKSTDNFIYSIDKYKTFQYKDELISNLMIDYEKVLTYSLKDYQDMLSDDNFSVEERELIKGIEYLIDREILTVDKKDIIDSLNGIKNRKANSFKDALQRILFFNQLLWQTGHYLNGLGRLDLILDKYYKNDIKNGIITRDYAKELLKEFLEILHKDYYFKSNSLYGDTGQIIIVGGVDSNNKYFYNDLSYIFIELMEELRLPDPKVLLRVNKDIPRDLMKLAVKCISTGIGCPLLANDSVIIPRLIEFGYDELDAYNYGTAACWEPYMTGKSFDQNNLKSISFMEPLRNVSNEELNNINNLDEFINLYKKLFDEYFQNFILEINNKKFNKDLLLSLFIDDCIKNRKDISDGGAKYNNYGFTGVGLSNLVNCLLAINKFVFVDQKVSLKDFNTIRESNFTNHEDLLDEIKNYKYVYGMDEDEIIDLTNNITEYVSDKFKNINNPLGGKYKFGFSAPSYIDLAIDFPASFDGRRAGEPFNVHISSDNISSYTELFNFASKLDYTINRFNGNVIDFFVTPNFIQDSFDKFVDFLLLSIDDGFFEMQMNVISSKVLIEARKNPEKYPNLIVRVWGFSAYFKDLPDEYKDYLIERALKSEGNCN